MRPASWFLVPAMVLAGCGRAAEPAVVRPNIDPVPHPVDSAAAPPGITRERVAPPDAAYAAGWMPLAPTGVDRFRRAHPEWDGRGVLIAILDGGLDPTIPGLVTTSTGKRKVIDLRDFSGEGRVQLQQARPSGDLLRVGGTALAGFSRVRAFSANGPWYAGTIAERPLGKLPASDLDGDGADTDSLAVVVTRGTDGWLLFADTDGNGSLAGERPVRDYGAGGEGFCWHRPGRECPVGVGVDLREDSGVPVLDLVFDSSGHGSHVGGIAAGHAIYGVAGFDGVAPGAELLGLKIANNANGGISTTGSIFAALEYAIAVARQRRTPLVVNLSSGVGNEREGQAAIDRMVDSVLAANPDVVMTISAGNDGPGLSTLGFPGSAERAISVGATFPVVFVTGASGAGGRPDPVAFFSSRGGEMAKPDLVTPGVAYSTVPAWDRGEERNAGTSMASPHAAGLAALLVSALAQQGKPIAASQVRHALMVTALPVPGDGWIEGGAGVPDVNLAWAWLAEGRQPPPIRVGAAGSDNRTSAALRVLSSDGAVAPGRFELRRSPGPPIRVSFRSSAPWLVAPAPISLADTLSRVSVEVRAAELSGAGAHSGLVTAWTTDTLLGPVARMPVTVVAPLPARDTLLPAVRLPASGVGRWFFVADSARPLEVVIQAERQFETALTSLHEPGGMPWREDNGLLAGAGEDAAIYQVDGRDVRAGLWEIDAIAPPGQPVGARLRLARSPFRIGAQFLAGVLEATYENLDDSTRGLDPGAALLGAEQRGRISRTGGDDVLLPVPVPAWATRVVIDLEMPPGQWERFTDFGVTFLRADGRQFVHQPLTYRIGRLAAEADDSMRLGPEQATLALLPGLATRADREPWTASISVRFYAAEPSFLEPAPGGEAAVGRGRTGSARFTVSAPPWPLDPGFVPLAVVWAETGSGIWTRELPLGGSVETW
ncbi:MAG: S8 family serine peptidase [Gemmatimonadales bacterium]